MQLFNYLLLKLSAINRCEHYIILKINILAFNANNDSAKANVRTKTENNQRKTTIVCLKSRGKCFSLCVIKENKM